MDEAANHNPRAACKGHDPELWFPISEHVSAQPGIQKAKTICFGCPLRGACLEDALERRTEFGIWGGYTPQERRTMLRRGGADVHSSGRSELVRKMATRV